MTIGDEIIRNSRYIRPILLVEDNPVDLDLSKRAFSGRKIIKSIQVAAQIELYWDVLNEPPV